MLTWTHLVCILNKLKWSSHLKGSTFSHFLNAFLFQVYLCFPYLNRNTGIRIFHFPLNLKENNTTKVVINGNRYLAHVERQ